MPLLPTLGRTVGTGVKAARLLVRGSVRGGAWATRRVGSARARGAAGEVGMIRLFDLHAVSCAGDALIAIGLAGTIFSVPLGEARSKVGLYLLITMVPFALLAPVVGPLLDHFRHGRRYALATTFLGRAFLAYVIADNLLGWGLYPAAFGVLALSRAYGVARSAAVPRLLPDGVGLSQVGARASVYGTFAGILVAPIGLLAFKFGPQWPLRVAAIIFLVGVVVALRLPPRADSDPPEALPRAWRTVLRIGRGTDRPLSGRLVVATLIGSASLRMLYGFLLLFLTFAIMGGELDTSLLGLELGRGTAVGVVGGALALGTFLSTAAGTGLRIRRPLALQSSGIIVAAGVAVLTTIFYNLVTVTLLALLTATFSGIAKLAVDASIQERVPERQRATAFAHSETVLMLAWVTGGGLGIIPFAGRLGIGLAALLGVLAAGWAAWSAARLHNERLSGRPETVPSEPPADSPAGPHNPSPTTVDPSAHPPADPWAETDQTTTPLGYAPGAPTGPSGHTGAADHPPAGRGRTGPPWSGDDQTRIDPAASGRAGNSQAGSSPGSRGNGRGGPGRTGHGRDGSSGRDHGPSGFGGAGHGPSGPGGAGHGRSGSDGAGHGRSGSDGSEHGRSGPGGSGANQGGTAGGSRPSHGAAAGGRRDDPGRADRGGDIGRGRNGNGRNGRGTSDPDTTSAPGRRTPAGGGARDGNTQRLDSGAAPAGRRWWQRKRKADADTENLARTGDRPGSTDSVDSGGFPSRRRAEPAGGGPARGTFDDARPGGPTPGPDRFASDDLSGDRPGPARSGRDGFGSDRSGPARSGGDGFGGDGFGGDGFGGDGFGGDGGAGQPAAPPGFHVYRPSSANSETRDGDPVNGEDT